MRTHNAPTDQKFKKSLLAVCIMACTMPVIAQDANQEKTDGIEEIIVSATKINLESAQNIKR